MKPSFAVLAAGLTALLSLPAQAEGQFTGSSVIASAPRPAVAAVGLPAAPPSNEPSLGGALWFPFAKAAASTTTKAGTS
ncbi:MAG: hypothetical protein EOO24_67075 [Comamonadaceae bacterium]|nr:MAG: hypothetical protein EOO24_67075 [Comamonadaceae bacterium]